LVFAVYFALFGIPEVVDSVWWQIGIIVGLVAGMAAKAGSVSDSRFHETMIGQTQREDAGTPVIEVSDNFTVFPVGVNVGGRPVIFSVLVRGKEDGSQAVGFETWLIPYDAVVQALKLEVTPLSDGQLDVRIAWIDYSPQPPGVTE
jgi:hypothetical protein